VTRPRAAAAAILGCIAGFVALELPAMRLYPGGTWWDRTTQGARFWQNFLCDLEGQTALNGAPNPLGASLAKAAMLLLVVSLVPFWLVVTTLFAELPRLGRAVRRLGLLSVAATLAVPWMPSDRFGAFHGVAVVVAGVPGLTAAAMAVAGLATREPAPRVAAVLGGSMLVFAIADFVLYVWTVVSHGPGTIVLPAVQKVALGLLLGWMVTVAMRHGGSTTAGQLGWRA